MPEESTNTEYQATIRTAAKTNPEAGASGIHDWKSGLRPNRTTGPTSDCRFATTDAMSPEESSTKNYKGESPAWHKPYSELCEAVLKTEAEVLMKLSGATEMAVFERLLELAGDEDASDERQNIGRAIDVILSLKAMKTQQGSARPSATERGCSSVRRTHRVLHHNGKIGYDTLA